MSKSVKSPKVTLPFTTRSLLEMCWGMTMNFSHEAQQQALGKVFTTEFMGIINERDTNGVNPQFLHELTMALSATVRSIGFIRACHVQYNDFNSDRLTRKRQSFEKMADFSSFSGSGLFAKVGSFVGAGSVTELVAKASLSPLFILPFALGGILAAFAVTAYFNWRVGRTYGKWANELTQLQSEYWRREFKPDVTDQLYNLCVAIKELVKRYYPKYPMKFRDELFSMTDEKVKQAISQQILPPDDLRWPPYTVTPEAKTATGNQLKTDSAKEDKTEQKDRAQKT